MILIAFFVIFKWYFLHVQERFEINSRRLFKLACDAIEETSAGFTARPYFAGKTEYSKEKAEGLARYLRGKYITKPLCQEQGATARSGRSTFPCRRAGSCFTCHSPMQDRNHWPTS